jgi:hypothetical protein
LICALFSLLTKPGQFFALRFGGRHMIFHNRARLRGLRVRQVKLAQDSHKAHVAAALSALVRAAAFSSLSVWAGRGRTRLLCEDGRAEARRETEHQTGTG